MKRAFQTEKSACLISQLGDEVINAVRGMGDATYSLFFQLPRIQDRDINLMFAVRQLIITLPRDRCQGYLLSLS